MKSKTLTIFIVISIILCACKKSNTNVDPRITAHYMFRPGTWWVYQDNSITDSMYVTTTDTKDGMPYMQINDVILSGHTVQSTHTIYIGAGPHSNQLQIWGYDLNGNTTPQVIFESDTPALGTLIGQGCRYSGIINMSSMTPASVSGTPVYYGIDYSISPQSQSYGNISYYFYPDFGIVQIETYHTPWGNLYLNLKRSHIIQ